VPVNRAASCARTEPALSHGLMGYMGYIC